MFTEQATRADAAAYARFLGAQLVSAKMLSRDADRSQYFAQCESVGNLLLDPDTGVRIDGRVAKRNRPAYVFADEVQHLAEARPDSLTLIFDQSFRRGHVSADLECKLTHFQNRGISGFAYASHASFLLLGRDSVRVSRALEALVGAGLPRRRVIVPAAPDVTPH